MDREQFFARLVSKEWEHILYCEDKNGRKVAFKSVGDIKTCSTKCYVSENGGPWKPYSHFNFHDGPFNTNKRGN